MPTYNEALFDLMVRHQIGVLRFSGSVRNQVWELLDATEADLRRLIVDRAARAGFETPGRLRALERLLERLRETRLRGWEEATRVWFEQMRELARAEPVFFQKLLNSAIPVELATVLPPPERLRAIVGSQPFEGKTLKAWAESIKAADLARMEDQIRIGLVQGEGPRAIARRIVGTASLAGRNGTTQVTRRWAASIVRTVSAGITAEARRAFMLANRDLAPQEVFTATLDSRTTPICRSLDGKVFDVGAGPRLPLHIGERSLYSPVVDGEVIGTRPRRSFTERSLLREFSQQNGISPPPTTRAGLPHGTRGAFDAFARARMRELTGTVPARTSYGEWLFRQPAAIQDDILGPTRGALFRRGGLTLDKFVEQNGRELTLAELADRHEGAFLAAGLDPFDF